MIESLKQELNQKNEKELMIRERTKKIPYKPIILGMTAVNLAAVLGIGIANIAWVVIVKVPNPVLLDLLYIALGC